jgi:hypothetical protein
MNEDLKIAVRIKESKISIRAEGNVTEYIPLLNEAGLTVSNSSQGTPYASAHLGVSNEELARKTLGALLMAPGIVWATPMPDFSMLWNKGS